MSDTVTGSTWSDQEVDLIVADYFDMLQSELAGQPYVKATHNRALQELTCRVPGSIERKHQNISAVLARLRLPWITGYKPLANFQNALVEGIGRYLAQKGEPILYVTPSTSAKVAEAATLWIGPPPVPTVEDSVETPRGIPHPI